MLVPSQVVTLRFIQLLVFDSWALASQAAPVWCQRRCRRKVSFQEGNSMRDRSYCTRFAHGVSLLEGHLYAYNVAGTTPVLAWDASAQLSNTSNWMNRRVYTWDGTNMVKIQVTPRPAPSPTPARLPGLRLAAPVAAPTLRCIRPCAGPPMWALGTILRLQHTRRA